MTLRTCLCLFAAIALGTSMAHADAGAEAEAGFGAGAWNAEKTSILDVRFTVGGHFDIGHNLVLHTGLTTDILAVDTTTNNGLLELGGYVAMTSPLPSGWSFGPRVAFEVVEKPIVLIGMRIDHRPITFGVDFVHMFASE